VYESPFLNFLNRCCASTATAVIAYVATWLGEVADTGG
jgi:hypothetical protein